MPKDVQTTTQLHSHVNKVMLKFLQAGLQQYMNWKFQMYKLDLENAEEPDIKFPNIFCIIVKAREFQKTYLLLLHWLHENLWLRGSQQTGKFFKRREYQTTLPVSWKTCMQVKK